NQVRREIFFSLKSMPWMSIPTVALFFAEVRGYSRLYDDINTSPYGKCHFMTNVAGTHHAFHPIDGFLQSLPYHIYPFIFPLHKVTYLGLYIFVNIWTVSIHDGDYRVPKILESIINGSAHHTDHHLYFDYNFGQYFTLWDKIGGSYKNPSALEGNGPHDLCRKLEAKERQENGMDKKSN
ncbi:hypothetical protein AB205_0106160, partial [Aquarana catesbeiana]